MRLKMLTFPVGWTGLAASSFLQLPTLPISPLFSRKRSLRHEDHERISRSPFIMK
jgi:hypothetical protein